jgi:hypothetical protein
MPKTRILAYFIIPAVMLAIAVFIELSSRNFLKGRFHDYDPHVFYYAQVAGLRRIHDSPDTITIGLFGSSVTAKESIPRILQNEVDRYSDQPVRVYNVSAAYATMADSYFKYRWAGKRRFDFAVFDHDPVFFRFNSLRRAVGGRCEDFSWFRRRMDVDRWYHPGFQTPCAIAYRYTTLLERLGLLYLDWPAKHFPLPLTDTTRNVALPAYIYYVNQLSAVARQRHERMAVTLFPYQRSGIVPRLSKKYDALVEEYNDATLALAKKNGFVAIDLRPLSDSSDCFMDSFHFNDKGDTLYARAVAAALRAEILRPSSQSRR